MNHRNILFSKIWPVAECGCTRTRLKNILFHEKEIFSFLIDSLLLYNCIFIPTQDFLALSALINIMGEENIFHLLDIKCLKFIRMKGWLGYSSNIGGGGIQAITALPTYNIQPPSKDAAASLLYTSEDSIKWALSSELVGPLNSPKEITKKVLESTKDIPLSEIIKKSSPETNKQILSNPELKKYFHSRGFELKLHQLEKRQDNQVRIYNENQTNWHGDSIDKFLLINFFNIEMELMAKTECLDNIPSLPVQKLFDIDFKRIPNKNLNNFYKLCEINNFPDIGSYYFEQRSKITNLIKFRETNEAKAFRSWFHEKVSDQSSTTEICQAYINLLQENNFTDSFPVRLFRFVSTQSIGIANTPAGILLSFIDSFLLDKFGHKSSPKIFLQKLEKKLR